MITGRVTAHREIVLSIWTTIGTSVLSQTRELAHRAKELNEYYVCPMLELERRVDVFNASNGSYLEKMKWAQR